MASREIAKLTELLENNFISEEEFERRMQEFSDAPLESPYIATGSTELPREPILDISVSLGSFYTQKPPMEEIKACMVDIHKTKCIRLFVSSTFQDMSCERELLSRKVFPAIRALCAQRGISFVDVDFRWGITREDAAGGKVLSLCLDAVDRCRPWCLGIVGHRYGWSAPYGGSLNSASCTELRQCFEDAAVRRPWVSAYGDRSVTELELLYAGLFYPQYALNMRVFIKYKNHDDVEDDPRLVRLKRALRESPLAGTGNVRDGYHTAEEFAEWALRDLSATIEKEFPLSTYGKSIDDPRTRERAAHTAHAEYLCNGYVAAADQLREISAYVNMPTVSRPFFVTGAPGIGKSSLLAHWLRKRYFRRTDNDESPSTAANEALILHYVVITGEPRLPNMASRLTDELRTLLAIPRGGFASSEAAATGDVAMVTEWNEVLGEAERRLAKKDTAGVEKVVIVIDGVDLLDEAQRTMPALYWMPTECKHVRVIVGCSDATYQQIVKNCEAVSAALRTREEYSRRVSTHVAVSPMDDARKRKAVSKMLAPYGKKLEEGVVSQIVQSAATNNPLYLRTLIEQLRLNGRFDELYAIAASYLEKASTLESLLIRIVEDWDREFQRDVSAVSPGNRSATDSPLRRALVLLCAARDGLDESELRDLLTAGASANAVPLAMTVSAMVTALADIFIVKDGVISIYYQWVAGVRKLVGESEFHNAVQRCHGNIARYYATRWRELRGNAAHMAYLANRVVREYPYHLWKVGDAAALAEFLKDFTNVAVLCRHGDRAELLRYWQTATAADATVAQQLFAEWRKALAAEWDTVFREKNSEKLFELTVLQRRLAQFFIEVALPKMSVPLLEDLVQQLARPGLPWQPMAREQTQAQIQHLYALALEKAGEISRAVEAATSALETRQRLLGNEHVDTADTQVLMAFLRKKQGNYPAALAAYREARRILERCCHGNADPRISLVLKLEGDVYRKTAEYKQAAELYQQALRVDMSTFGDRHPRVAELLEALGRIWKKQGKYADAERNYKTALTAFENTFGKDHIKTAELCVDLADVYRKLGRLAESENLYQRALTSYTARLGNRHPDVAEVKNAFSLVYKMKGTLEASDALVREAIDIAAATLGRNHVKVGMYTNNLADLEAIRGKYSSALALHRTALSILEGALGPEHPDVSEVLNSLGMVCKKVARFTEAAAYYERALKISQKVYGNEHYKSAMYLHNLAVVYRKRKDLKRAKELYTTAMEINTKLFDEYHPYVAQNLNGLGMVEKNLGNYDEALEIHNRALEIFRSASSMNEEKIALTFNLIAEVLRKMARLDYHSGAERYYQDALAINRRLFGEEHPEVAENINGIAQVFVAQFKYAEAEQLFKKAIGITERTLGEAHPHVVNRYKNLMRCYERMGEVAKAVEIHKIVQDREQKMQALLKE